MSLSSQLATPAPSAYNITLAIAGGLSAAAALLHFSCIIVGAPMYRFLGAGNRMAELASEGHWYPAFVTLCLTALLLIWAWYAFAGGGVICRPPLLKTGLCMITAFYLLRGAVILPLSVSFLHGKTGFYIAGAGGSVAFWVWSSLICLVFGIVHLVGLAQNWLRL